MRLIYWLDEVTSEALGFILVLLLGGIVIGLEKLGLIRLDQTYVDAGVYDPVIDTLRK